MRDLAFSVVITTYNRVALVGRAIRSVLLQDCYHAEVIVVDDASTDGTADYVQNEFPMVRYFRQEINKGAGAARNRGIQEAKNPWVIILDDDDELARDALKHIASKINSIPESAKFPVLQFAHANGFIPEPYALVRLEHYMTGFVKGDFLPVINRNTFVQRGFKYSETLSVGEHLLWWQIAKLYGIPTWNIKVAILHEDAPIRLTSPENQIRRAKVYAEMQELTLKEFGELLKAHYPSLYRSRCLGAATYWLLAGDRTKAREHLRFMLRSKFSAEPIALWMLSFMPLRLIRKAFLVYRRSTKL